MEDEQKDHAKKKGRKGPKVKPGKHLEQAQMLISFGSGAVATQVASDEVRVGSVKSYMENGLLLITDQKLEIYDRFEGILGLGRPDFKGTQKDQEESSENLHVPSFFEQAQVQRFSMCFNHQADGVMGMNTAAHANPLSSVGQMHWGLDFHGISIGEQQVHLGFCDPRSKKKGMETACGLIPDSGTTLIAASEPHLLLLFESVCKNWKRCWDAHKQLLKQVAHLSPAEKASVFDGKEEEVHPVETLQLLLAKCSDWMAGVDLNKEMPKLTFHVAGANGNKEDLVITPRNYVLLNEAEVEMPMIIQHGRKKMVQNVRERKAVCQMAFTTLDFDTERNGPVWIMGMPLFYEHTAHYDRGNGKETRVTMGFTQQDHEGCGQCESYGVKRNRSDTSLLSVSQSMGPESLNRITKPPLIGKFHALKSMWWHPIAVRSDCFFCGCTAAGKFTLACGWKIGAWGHLEALRLVQLTCNLHS